MDHPPADDRRSGHGYGGHVDLNDFDETLPGPFEWDVKRLAASLVLAGRDNGFTASKAAR